MAVTSVTPQVMPRRLWRYRGQWEWHGMTLKWLNFFDILKGFDLHARVIHVTLGRLTQRFESQVPSCLRRVAVVPRLAKALQNVRVTLITYRCLHEAIDKYCRAIFVPAVVAGQRSRCRTRTAVVRHGTGGSTSNTDGEAVVSWLHSMALRLKVQRDMMCWWCYMPGSSSCSSTGCLRDVIPVDMMCIALWLASRC